MTAGSTRNVRSDARHNRAHVVRVARAIFATHGLNVTMREIARQADLGVATVYRHFPTRDDLITAVFAEQVAACSAKVADAVADPDPWRGITAIVDEICTRHALDPGFTAVLLGSAATTKVFATERAENVRAIASLFERARREGVLRPDLMVADVQLVLAATSAVFAPSPARALVEVRRLAALLLQGMRAHPTCPPEPMPARSPHA